MSTNRKLLIASLALNATVQFLLGSWVLFGLHSLLDVEHMTYSDDLMIFSVYFGLCLYILSTLGFFTIGFVRKGQPMALFLSKFLGWWLIVAGIAVYFKTHRMDLAGVDMLRGALIAFFAHRTKDLVS